MLYPQHLANDFHKNARKVKKNSLQTKLKQKQAFENTFEDTTKIPYIGQLYLTDPNDNNEFQR